MDKKNIQVKLLLLKETSSHQNQNFSWLKSMSTETFSLFYHNLTIFSFVFQIKDHKIKKKWSFRLQLYFWNLRNRIIYNLKSRKTKLNFSCYFEIAPISSIFFTLFFFFSILPLFKKFKAIGLQFCPKRIQLTKKKNVWRIK